ncbi:TetR/AcrR family transcriptional regulator [Pseudonocardia sp. CA-107938]|uniref:TetR/AcrR family transcriptional regulator n=1 Tax=Pseudonocardia sp. CA-107938 TaxID=3240021 RepID=UPI003D950A8B
MGKGEHTREVILDEAGGLAARVGLGGLTIGELAARTELSKSGLFAHFGSKESLQLQVFERTVTRITDVVIRPALRAPRGEPRLRTLVDRWLDWASANGGCPLLAATFEFDDQPGPLRDRVAAAQNDWIDTLTTVCTTGIAEGHFRPDLDPRQLAVDIEGVLLAYHVMHRLLADPAARDRALHSIDALIAAAR